MPSKKSSQYNKVAGIVLLVIAAFVFYYRSDILVELFRGRPLQQLSISSLVFPIILLIIGIFLILNKKGNGKKPTS